MRKSKREVTDKTEILKLIDECDTIRLGLHDEPYPYIVPLSFGWENIGDTINFYVHCAKEGKKLDLIDKNANVCIEGDILDGYVDLGHSVTADYKSFIAFGKAEQVFGSQLIHGLKLLLKHCRTENYSAEECAALGITAVVKITVEKISAKKRFN